jgi:hypothetical protein
VPRRGADAHSGSRDVPGWLQELFFGPQPIVFVQRTLGLGWPFPFRVISLLGISWGVILALGLAMWMWGRKAAYSLAGIIVLEALVSLVLNRVFAVERSDAATPTLARRPSVAGQRRGRTKQQTSSL